MTDKPLLFRMDSGNDALENMQLLLAPDTQIDMYQTSLNVSDDDVIE